MHQINQLHKEIKDRKNYTIKIKTKLLQTSSFASSLFSSALSLFCFDFFFRRTYVITSYVKSLSSFCFDSVIFKTPRPGGQGKTLLHLPHV